MIYLVTSRNEAYDWEFLEAEGILCGNFDEFIYWIENEHHLGYDVETTMVPDGPNQNEDREITVAQLGTEEVQWVFDIPDLDKFWIDKLKSSLVDDRKTLYAHNAKFEYITSNKSFGITIEYMHDTMLMSQVLNTGIDTYKGYHSLQGCLKRFFDIEISKDEQTSFNGEPLSVDQIKYAATDVILMKSLFDSLKKELDSRNLWYVYNEVEREVFKAYSDMELNPMRLDTDYWDILASDLIKEDTLIEQGLNKEIFNDPKLVDYLKKSDSVLKFNLIQPVDELCLKWGSNVHRAQVLELLVPSLPKEITTKPKIKKWLKSNKDNIPEIEEDLITKYMNRNYDDLNDYLVTNHMNWLLKNDFFIKENTVNLNWASTDQRLYVFQFYYPKLQSTGKKVLAKITANKLINSYKKYAGAHKNLTTYGPTFPDKYMKRDGQIAPSGLGQIKSTGRISSISGDLGKRFSNANTVKRGKLSNNNYTLIPCKALAAMLLCA